MVSLGIDASGDENVVPVNLSEVDPAVLNLYRQPSRHCSRFHKYHTS